MISVVLADQLVYLRDQGFDITVVADDNPEFDTGVRALGLRGVGIKMYRQPRPVQDLRSLARMTRFMRSESFGIVHSVEPKAGLLAMVAARLSRTPVRVHTYTGQVWAELTGWWRETARAGDLLIGRLGTHLLADSASGAEFLIEQGRVARNKIRVLANGSISGINLGRFHPAPNDPAVLAWRRSLSIEPQDKVVLFVGRVVEDKGIAELLEAFAALSVSRPDVHLVVVGPLEPERAPLSPAVHERLTRSRGVHYVGRQDPVPYFQGADLFCLPSYREGFPTVVLEAAACGIPTVATRIVGNTDAVVDEATGLLVPVKQAAPLADAVGRLLDRADERLRLGAAALDRARRQFDAVSVNAALVRFYVDAYGAIAHDGRRPDARRRRTGS